MATTKWELDPTHSEVQFKVKHLVISTVTGTFKKFNVNVETNGNDFTTAKIHFNADVNSVSTNNEQRDNHLKSPDFFDAANHPQLEFEGTKLEKISDDEYKLHGNLTIREITKSITLNVEFGGIIQDPWGNTRVGFTIEGKVNRKEYGLMWHAVTETGGLVAGDDVKIHVNAEFIKEKDSVAAIQEN
ncbi:MAG TPA: YceI family protein [Flavipsychrobacter sp.]|nr:YceI family protein [Flavipsychrobacter sp.]